MKRFIVLLVFALAAASCATGVSSNTSLSELRQKQFEQWVSGNPGGEYTALGSYVISRTDGPKKVKVEDAEKHPYIMVHYTIKDLKGNITATTREDVAKQLGTYKDYNYYGPGAMYRAKNSLYAGVEEMVSSMYVGDRVTIAVPGWLLTTSRYDSKEEYLEHFTTNTDGSIFDIEICEVVEDFNQWQYNALKGNATAEMKELIENGVYIQKTLEAEEDTKEFESGVTVYVKYVCRRWDGQVVDTNIREVALEAFGKEAASNSFSAMKITWAEDYGSITTTGGGSLIEGFKKGLRDMKDKEKALVFMFNEYAYGSNGSGSKIPAYCPIYFELEVSKEEI